MAKKLTYDELSKKLAETEKELADKQRELEDMMNTDFLHRHEKYLEGKAEAYETLLALVEAFIKRGAE